MTDKIHASTAAPLDLSHSCSSCVLAAESQHTEAGIRSAVYQKENWSFYVHYAWLILRRSCAKDSTSVTANIFLKETINRQNKMNVINSSAWSGCFQRSTHFRSAWKISWSLSTLMGLYKGIGELLTRALQQILPIKKQFTHLWFYFCALLSRKALRRN